MEVMQISNLIIQTVNNTKKIALIETRINEKFVRRKLFKDKLD